MGHCILGGQWDFLACSRPRPGSRPRSCRGRNLCPERSHRSRPAGRRPCGRACAGPARAHRGSRRRTRPAPGPGGRRAARPARMSGVGSRTSSGSPSSLESFVARRPLGAEVRHRGGHDHDVGAFGGGADRVLHVGRRLHVDPRDRRRDVGRERERRGRHQGHRRAAAGRGDGDGVALLARGAVRDEAHRIERLAGAAGAHDDARARAGRAGSPRPSRSRTRATITRGIGQPTFARVAAGQPPALGRDDLDAAPLQRGEVLAHRGVLPHLGVHGGADDHRRPGGQERGARGGRRRARRRSGRACAPWPARPRRGRPAGRAWCAGIGEASSHRDRCTGSEARAEKVTAPTKRVASSVSTGVTCTPASTSCRQTSTAL